MCKLSSVFYAFAFHWEQKQEDFTAQGKAGIHWNLGTNVRKNKFKMEQGQCQNCR